MNFSLLIVVNIILAICTAIFMYVKRKIFSSLRDAFIILGIGLAIVAALLIYLYAGLDWETSNVAEFLLLNKSESYWSLTKICLIGYYVTYCGLIALTFSVIQRMRSLGSG